MRTLKIWVSIMVMFTFIGLNQNYGQWATSGTHIYNTNTGNVGIGNSTPVAGLMVYQTDVTRGIIITQGSTGSA